MRDHPTIKVCISMDNSWCHTKRVPIAAKNVIAIADTGAQTNVWSLRSFLAAGFNCSILIPASDLIAANHSGIKIEGAFFDVIKRLGADKAYVQCHAMIYVSTLYLSHATLSDLGVLSSQFPLVGEHPPLTLTSRTVPSSPFALLFDLHLAVVLPSVNLLTLVPARSRLLYRRSFVTTVFVHT